MIDCDFVLYVIHISNAHTNTSTHTPTHMHTDTTRTEAATERDRFFSAEEAVQFGLVDRVIPHRLKTSDSIA